MPDMEKMRKAADAELHRRYLVSDQQDQIPVRVGVTGKHVIDPEPEQDAYDVCLHCGQAIQQDIYGRGLVTMIPAGNPECYKSGKEAE